MTRLEKIAWLARGGLRRSGLAFAVNYTTGARVGSVRFRIPVVHGTRLYQNEPWMLQLLEQVLRDRDGAFVDVGVNLGQTLLKVRAVDPQRPYVGFEPNPSCVAYLEKLMRANRMEDVTIVPVGVSDAPGILTLNLYSNSETGSSASLEPQFRTAAVRRRKHVPVMNFAQLPAGLIEGAGILKIDVEGSELAVVRGLQPLIERDRPHIIIEVLPCRSMDDRRHPQQTELQALIERLGYSISRVEKSHGRFAGLKTVPGFGIHSDLDQCDYLLSPVPPS